MIRRKCKHRSYCLVIFLTILGVLSYLGSLIVPSPIALLIRGLGVFLFGAALIDGLLTVHFQLNIENQVNNLETSIKTLQNTVAIASGAVESGLTAVYSERKECLEEINKRLNQMIDDSKKAGQGSPKIEVKMLGISLGDFLCPHGLLQSTFRELMKLKNFSVDIIILKDESKSAYRRAIREEEGKFREEDRNKFDKDLLISCETLKRSYRTTKCHDELKTATDYLHDLATRKIIDRDRPNQDSKVEATLCVYEYDYDPMTFIFMVNDDMFIENYHLAGRGGEAPILRVAKLKRQSSSETSRLYEIYSGHFNAMKKYAQEIKPENTSTNDKNEDSRNPSNKESS